MTTTEDAGTMLAVLRPDGALVRVTLATDTLEDALRSALVGHGRVIAEASEPRGVQLVVTLTHVRPPRSPRCRRSRA